MSGMGVKGREVWTGALEDGGDCGEMLSERGQRARETVGVQTTRSWREHRERYTLDSSLRALRQRSAGGKRCLYHRGCVSAIRATHRDYAHEHENAKDRVFFCFLDRSNKPIARPARELQVM